MTFLEFWGLRAARPKSLMARISSEIPETNKD